MKPYRNVQRKKYEAGTGHKKRRARAWKYDQAERIRQAEVEKIPSSPRTSFR